LQRKTGREKKKKENDTQLKHLENTEIKRGHQAWWYTSYNPSTEKAKAGGL
jgi:hypothetical protein